MALTYRTGAVLAAAVCFAAETFGHGGGLNADGCHTNRKTGDYHCHRAPAMQPVQPTPAQRALVTPLPVSAAPPTHGSSPTCYTGPRGGTYTITASGKKNYGGC